MEMDVKKISELLENSKSEYEFFSSLTRLYSEIFESREVRLKGKELIYELGRFFIVSDKKFATQSLRGLTPNRVIHLVNVFTERYGKYIRALLYSGGMDSYIAYHYLGKPRTFYFDLQHRYAKKEKIAVGSTIPTTLILKHVRLAEFEQPDANIPMRNLYLVMTLANFLAKKGFTRGSIYIVCQKGEMSIPDRSETFFSDINRIIKYYGPFNFDVVNPFPHMTKAQMVKWYKENVGDIDMLKRTVGCYSPTPEPCLACSACFRRNVAFAYNDIPLDGEAIKTWEGIKTYIERIKNKELDPDREQETVEVLRKWGYEI